MAKSEDPKIVINRKLGIQALRLRETRERLAGANDLAGRLCQKIDRQRKELARFNLSDQDQRDEIRQQKMELAALGAANSDQATRIIALTEEQTALQGALGRANRELENSLNDKCREVDRLTGKVDALRRANRELENFLNDKCREVDRLTDKVDALRVQFKDERIRASNLKLECDRAISKLRCQRADFIRRIHQLLDVNNDYLEQRRERDAKIATLQSMITGKAELNG